MAAYVKFHSFIENIGRKAFNLHTDTLKVMLTNEVPDAATDAVKADIVEIAAVNGYPAGGVALANQSWTQVAGLAKLLADDPVIIAVGGAIGPYRCAVLYDDTAVNDELMGYWDYGASSSLNDGEELTVDISQVNGALQGS